MTKKHTKDDYFAAASALDLLFVEKEISGWLACELTGCKRRWLDAVYNKADDMIKFSRQETNTVAYDDELLLAVQLGCEMAGLA